jgi:hypothetical protein
MVYAPIVKKKYESREYYGSHKSPKDRELYGNEQSSFAQ